jgi:hypothetical protein
MIEQILPVLIGAVVFRLLFKAFFKFLKFGILITLVMVLINII